MEHLSEVLKILDGALKANASMAASYAGLLADKLDSTGETSQARRVRERLTRAPSAIAIAQDGARGHSTEGLPVDGESRLHTVDFSQPDPATIRLILSSAPQQRIGEFLDTVRHHDELARAGAAMSHRLLIYGRPGTGKTQTARWIAGQLGLPLLTVRCDTLVSSLLGQTSKNLRRVFEHAEQRPCALFLDEFDALAGARGNERDVGELQRVVIALLQNMDALPDNTIVIAATNHERLLDPAVWRRFPFQIPMPMPDAALRELLWRQLLGDFAPKTLHWSALVDLSAGASGSLIEQVCLDTKRTAVLTRTAFADETELFRRLGLSLCLSRGEILASTGEEVRWLRRWDERRFSLRELARLYGMTTRTITNLIKEDSDGNTQHSDQ